MGAEQDWALFLDFDGTLVDIAETPDGVVVEPDLPDTLLRLRTLAGGALALVSGRPIATLDRFLATGTFDAAGLHGLEARIAGALDPCRPEDHPALRRGVAWLRETLEAPGVVIEDKGCSVGVHWRVAPDHAALAKGAAEELARALGPDYRIQHGKMVAEVLPTQAGKGGAIARFLDHPSYTGRRPLFVGDDLTDEDGFAVVNARGGASIRVGPGETQAAFAVSSAPALRDLLRAWADRGTIDLGAEHLRTGPGCPS
jgi:trehalose 6-phosphate phosphatase